MPVPLESNTTLKGHIVNICKSVAHSVCVADSPHAALMDTQSTA